MNQGKMTLGTVFVSFMLTGVLGGEWKACFETGGGTNVDNSIAESICSFSFDTSGDTFLLNHCEAETLLLTPPNKLSLVDGKCFWLKEIDNICPDNKCPALCVDHNDRIAVTSIWCKDCGDQNVPICRGEAGASCASSNTASITFGGPQLGCPITETRHGDKTFLISPIRRTLADSHLWCKSQNGTSLPTQDHLHVLDSMVLPDLKVFWIADVVGDLNGGGLGVALTTEHRTAPAAVTFTSKLWLLIHEDPKSYYPCICVKKDRTTTTMTSVTTPTTTTVTTPTTTTVTTPTTTTVTTPTTTTVTTPTTTTVTTPTTTTVTTPTTTTVTTPTTTTVTTPTTTTTRRTPGESLFKNIHNMDGYVVSQAQSSNTVTLKTKTQCALQCNRDAGCNSFFYDGVNSLCQLTTDRWVSPAGLQGRPGAKYYERKSF